MKIFIYGATGQIGSIVTSRLLEEGHEVLAGTREPNKQEKKPGLKWVEVDSEKPESGLEALHQVDAVFLLSPPLVADQYAVLNPWIQRAKKAELKKLVLMTAMGVDLAPPEAPFRKLELSLISSGIPYNIIRPNWFMENFNTFWISGILEKNTIFFPGKQAKTSFIDIKDIAEAALVLLQSDENTGKEFTFTGEESLTHDQVAKILSDVTGKQISYADISPEDFHTGLTGAGIPEDYADLLVMLAGNLADGHSSGITNSIKELTGRAPVRFSDYAISHKKDWL